MAEEVNILNVENTIKNVHKVPQKQWKRWNDRQRVIFNHVFSSMLHNQEMFKHPKQAPMSSEHWKTPCWNAAWTAADAAADSVFYAVMATEKFKGK